MSFLLLENRVMNEEMRPAGGGNIA